MYMHIYVYAYVCLYKYTVFLHDYIIYMWYVVYVVCSVCAFYLQLSL